MHQPPILLDSNALENANKKNHEADVKLHASKIAPDTIAVSCFNAEHPGGHVCHFRRIGTGDLWGWCTVAHDGEPCPAAINKKVCHHLSAARILFLALEWQEAERNRARAEERRARLRLIDQLLGAASRRPVRFGVPHE